MGIFRKPSGAVQNAPINQLQVNQATNGIVIPAFTGTVRLPMNLIWGDDFKTLITTQKSGGGGIFGLSGGKSTTTTTTTYQTAFLALLGYGQISHIASVWNGSGKVQAIEVTESFTVPPGGGTHTPAPPGGGGFKGVRGATFAQTYSQTLSDFGAPTSTVLSGTFQAPMLQVTGTPGAGQFQVTNTTTGATAFSAADAGKTIQLTYTANFQTFTSEEEDTIPGGGTIQVPNSTQYGSDGGVNIIDPNTFLETPMVRVTGTPATGQYTVNSTGLYTFATADHFKLVRITWQQNDPTANDASAVFNFTTSAGIEGQSPWSYLTSNHPDAAIGYSGMATIQSSALQLGASAEMPQLNFEVIGPYTAGTGTSGSGTASLDDCNPSDVLYAYLADNKFGIGFPTTNIEWGLTPAQFTSTTVFPFVPAATAPQVNATSFWAANNFFISTFINNQTTVSAEFAKILEAGQTAIIWSEGLLKLRPYGDTSAAGNGFIYQPLTQPIFDLGLSDFIGDSGQDPLKVNLSSIGGKFNTVRINFSNRLNDYETDVIQEENLASIQTNGTRPEDPQDYSDFIRTPWAAQWAANMRVKRISNIRSTYEFTLPFVYDILEPMDIVTLTHPNYGFVQKPVRVTKIEDDPDKGLAITAEDFPYGVAKPTLYPKQTNLDTTIAPTLQEPGNASATILELPNLMTGFQGYTYRIFATPSTPATWGGVQVWLSGDNVEYDAQGSITQPALTGVLSGAFDSANLIPDPTGSGETWTGDASLVWTAGIGGLSDGGWKYIGTGAASTFRFQKSQLLTVTPGQQYTLSCWIDATHVTSTTGGGSPVWEVTDSAVSTTYASIGMAIGQVGWLSTTFTVPTGVTSVRVICDTDNCTVASGQPLIFSDPQLMHTVSIVCDNNLQLLPGSDFDFSTTAESCLLALVDASGTYEIVAYHDAVLTGVNTYQVGNFQRGLFGTTAGSHLSGVKVIKLSQGYLEQTYSADLVGTTNFCKLTSFNTVGAREQDINSVSPLTFSFTGAFPGAFDQQTGDAFNDKNVRNPDFESGDHDWTKGSGFTIVADSTNAYSGSYVAKWTETGSNSFLRNSLLMPVQPKSVLTANCMIKRTAGTGSGAVRIDWIAQDGITELSATIGTTVTSSTYQNSRVQGVAPANAWYGRVEGIAFTGTSTVLYFDSFELADITQNVSTSMNGQGSIVPGQAGLINYTCPTSSQIIVTWNSQSLLRADGSSLVVNPSNNPAKQMLLNGQGETGTVGSQAPNWTNSGGNNLVIDTDAGKFIDSQGMKITSSAGAGLNSISTQQVNLIGGVTYAIEGFISSDALTGGAGFGGLINCGAVSGITGFSIITKFGAYDAGLTTVPTIGIPADGVARGLTFVQCYFIPTTSGVFSVGLQNFNQTAGRQVWFDNIFLYPFDGASYGSLSATTGYYLYPYVEVSTGNLKFANGSPPTTSASDTFVMNTNLDGRYPLLRVIATTPTSGGGGSGFGGTGGGFGSCPESNEPVYVERYSSTGELIFTGEIKAGEVQHGRFHKHSGRKTGDFLKGYSFNKNTDVYRAVQKVMVIPCGGWSIVNGHRVTSCETIYLNGQWMPAWKASGATHDRFSGYKIFIQVEADEDDEHNYYVTGDNDLLIHNGVVLPC